MAKVPRDIWAHLESSESLLEDADLLPGASKHNASRYFLYIKAWELYRIADDQFDAWAQQTALDPKTMRDHGYKLDGSPEVQYITIQNGKAIETTHGSGKEKEKLLQALLYGSNSQSRTEMFIRGWFFDDFRNTLIGKMKLLRTTLQAIEELL